MTVLYFIFLSLFLLLSVVLCLVILVQESKSMGLGASFGGDPGTSLFGTSTADVLKKFTATLGVLFAISCVVLSLWSSHIGRKEFSKAHPQQVQEVEEHAP